MSAGVDLQGRLERLVAERRLPGASLALHAGGRLATAVAGVANRRAGWPVTPDTLFQLGSVSKIHTALAVLSCAAAGRCDLDQPVARRLPEWQGQRADDRLAKVTPRHLLSHTSGLQSQHFEDHGRGDGALRRLVTALAADRLVHPPGAHFSYSNTAYAVAGRLLHALTGRTWDEAVAELLCEPLGLGHTVTLPEDVLLHPAAVGARHGEDGAPGDVQRWYGSRALTPSGGVSTTAAELVALALEATRPDGSERLGLAPEHVAAMLRPHADVLSAGTRAWGLGWTLFETADGSLLAGHNGDTPGQAAFLRVAPEQRVALALLVNCQVSGADVEDLLADLLEDAAGIRPLPSTGAPAGEPDAAVPVEPLLGSYGQDRYEVEVTAGEAPGTVTLATHQWGAGPLEWYGEADVRRRRAAEVHAPDRVVADRTWWFLERAGDGRFAYVTNGHLLFPRR